MASSRTSAFRLCAPQWAATALSGEGARKYGGRWNSSGHPVVYLGESRALTALELLVHLPSPKSRTKLFTLLEISLPANAVTTLPPINLPRDWQSSPAQRASMEVGNKWLQEQKSLALRVPSALLREESIILLNPLHPDFKNVQTVTERTFRFDERL